MGFEKEKIRQIRMLLVFAACLILAIIYSSNIYSGLGLVFGMLKPFLYGGAIAFVLNIPMNFFESLLQKSVKGKEKKPWMRPVSIMLSLFSIVLILILAFSLILPQLGKTITELGNKIPGFIRRVYDLAEQVSREYPKLQEWIEGVDFEQIDWKSWINNIVEFLKSGMTNMLSSTVTIAGSIIGGVVNSFIALIFSLYVLAGKETLGRQAKKLLAAYTSPKHMNRILKVFGLLYRNFSNFISGQCKEAVILGSMFVIAMTICRMPYALLVGVVVAITALIPVVGAFIGCVLGAFLILVDSPIMAFWFVILFLVLQQIEGNLIYPRVVGSSVGLPSIWVLAAVTIGGSLFGIAGMLIFIPLLSTVYMLLRDDVNDRMDQKSPSVPEKSLKEDTSENTEE